MKKKYNVGILGATGSVGQRFIQLLEHHPWLQVTEVVASERSAGKKYHEAVTWKMDTNLPSAVANLMVKPPQPDSLNCDFVFSGLDSSVAGEIEKACAAYGLPVISNSKNNRMEPDVPLLVADVNPEHIKIIPTQQKNRRYKSGFLVTNPNCSTIGLVTALKPLHDAFGVELVHVTTMQAVSGAGYPGLSSMDILDNVVPYIGDEEEKMETEPNKILATYDAKTFSYANLAISAMCNRVGVVDGHMESVSVKLREKSTPQKVQQVMEEYTAPIHDLDLPSLPHNTIVVRREPDRPQTRLDRNTQKGMSTVVGRIRPCPIHDVRFSVLVHNTIRGAAGIAILNSELLITKNYITR